jgi:AbrB family looped-hinge helix DNA binding protein
MATQLTIDKAGRIVLPKALRDELHLVAGDSLDLESAGEEITLRPVRGTGPLIREQGVWVFRTGDPIPASLTDGLLRQIRIDRDLANRGEGE